MSVPSTDLKNKYAGNGVQTEWPFTFKIFTKEEILVKKITSGGEFTLTLDVDYTVSGAGEDEGSGVVTYPILGDKLAVGEFIVLKPNLEYSQRLVLLNQNTFPPKPVEYALDRLAMQIKQVAEQLSRSLQLTDTYDGSADDFIALINAGSAGLIASIKGTSLTSVAIGTGAKTFTTQSGKSWSLGQRLRAASDDGLKVIEGPVTAYSGTTLTIRADFSAGAGSHADWNIFLAGERGANGAGSGDLLAANNGSDFASKPTTFDNLKQAATTSYSGVMRIATEAEVLAGLVTNAGVTPETLQAKIDALPAVTPSGIVVSRQVFTSSGTWTKPANLLYADVEVVGGGGDGGGGSAFGSGGGGGGGGYTKKLIITSSLGATESVTVGGVSGTSSFGTHCSATGGGTGGNNSSDGGTSSGGGAGLGVGGDIIVNGTKGSSGLNGGPNPSTSRGHTVVGGDGGGSIFGGGGNGAKCSVGGTMVASGEGGSTYGGGGGGGASLSGGTRNGGAGIQGVVIVTEYRSA